MAKRSADQALAADGLARAHKAAGAALAPLTSAGDGLPSATVSALTATATAYTALASAARARLPQPYANAGRTVTGAEADLRQAMTKAGAAMDTASRTITPVREPAASAATQTDTQACRREHARGRRQARRRDHARSGHQARRRAPARRQARRRARPRPTQARRRSTAADAKPAAESRQPTDRPTQAATAEAPAAARPVASAAEGMDLTLVVIGLLCVLAAFLAIRGTMRQFR